MFIRESAPDPEVLRSRVVYGEAHPYAETLNLRGAAHQLYDGAGVIVNERFDFKGNLLESARQLGIEPRVAQDWTPLAGLTSLGAIETAAAPQLESETFASTVAYDALNRPYQNNTPDGSIIPVSRAYETIRNKNVALVQYSDDRLVSEAEWLVEGRVTGSVCKVQPTPEMLSR